MAIKMLGGAAPLLRADAPRVPGGNQVGVPDLVEMMTGTLAIEYGTQLPDALLSTFTLDTPIFDRIMRMTGAPIVKPERAAVYGIFTGVDFTGGSKGAFTIGGDPPGINIGPRTFGSEIKKSYGAMAGMTDVDIIASGQVGMPTTYMGERFANDKALLLRMLTQKTLTALDYACVRGNQGSDPREFDGIETRLTVNAGRPFVQNAVVSSGTALADQLDSILMAEQSFGVRPTELWMHPYMKQALIKSYLAQTGVTLNLNMGDSNQTFGLQGSTLLTAVGELPIITSYKFSISGTAPNFSGDIFIIAPNHDGIPLMNIEWQVRPTMLDLARVPGYYTSQVMAVWCHGVLVERSNWWAQGRIIGAQAGRPSALALQTNKP